MDFMFKKYFYSKCAVYCTPEEVFRRFVRFIAVHKNFRLEIINVCNCLWLQVIA